MNTNYSNAKRYTKSHEWVILNDDIATVGISNFAQNELSDVVYVEMPETNTKINEGDNLMVIESVKVASDVYTPVTGEIVETNQKLNDEPALINQSAEEDGWLVKIRIENVKEFEALLTPEQYQENLSNN